MSIEDPKTFEDLLAFMERYCATIYVRDFVDGKPGTYSLVQLPVARAIHHVCRWLRDGVIPARLVTGDPEPAEEEAK